MTVFYSYCHADEEYRIELEKWLKQLVSDGAISEWHDRKITAGTDWERDIEQHLSEADVLLLLVSQDFLASEACRKELKYGIENCDQVRTVPIILKPCAWKDSKISGLQAIPKDAKPISSWRDRDEAWLDVYERLKDVLMDAGGPPMLRQTYCDEMAKIEFVSDRKPFLTIDDIYVFQGVLKRDADGLEEERILDPTELIDKHDMAIIKGDELSGKTTLAFRIQKLCIDAGIQPVLFDGWNVHKTTRFKEFSKKTYLEQCRGDFDEWWESSDKCAIVDNYNHRIIGTFVQFLKRNYAKVYLLLAEEEYLVYFKDDQSLVDFALMDLPSLTRSRQETLIRKWLQLSDSEARATPVNDRQVDQVESKVDDIISKHHIVPRYPFYVLTILQSIEKFMPTDYRITAHGHCYQAIVTAQLLRKGIRPDQIDSAFNFLTVLASCLFQTAEAEQEMDSQKYERFKDQYRADFIIEESLINKIESTEYPIIRKSENSVRFEYKYSYYYFAGRYFASNRNPAVIERLVDRCWDKDYAYLIIFTVHHANDTDLIDEILLHCTCAFDHMDPARLNHAETAFMDALMTELPRSILNSGSVSQYRSDERDVEERTAEPSFKDEQGKIPELEKALRIIDILGQILKNRSGSFRKEKVIQILEHTQELGLRVLNYLLQSLRSEELRSWLTARLAAEENKVLGDGSSRIGLQEKRRILEKNLQFVAFAIALGMTMKIATAISADKLVRVNDQLTEEKQTPAYKIVNLLLQLRYRPIDIRLLQKYKREFDKDGNRWGSRTLSICVQHFLNTHRIDFRKRQQICELFELRYIPNQE